MKVSGAALLALAAAFFFDSGGTLILALFAAAVHEAGHYGALKLFRGRIRELKLELLGSGCSAILRCPIGLKSLRPLPDRRRV